MYFGKTPFVGKNVKKPWWEIWADEGGFTCVIDILLRIPPPSSSFWILYFTLGYHICTQWGQQVESSMFPNEARDRGRAKYPPIWTYWAFYHLFNIHLATFMAHNMGDYLYIWNHVNRFQTMKCLNRPKSETTSPYPSSWVVHHPVAQAENSNQCHLHFLWSLLLSAYYLFAQMMALAMSVIFQEGGMRSSKQTTFSKKKIWGLIWLLLGA